MPATSMFQKSFRIKTQTAIKGSDRKKLRTEVGRQYPSVTDHLAEIIPNKEEMTTVKIYTHNGDTVLVYVVQRSPIFFEHDKAMYPTVYTLWKFPELLPVFTTWPAVFNKLAGGADLMLPGLIIKGDVTPRSLGHMGMMDKGTVCAVKLLGNRVPIAVGRTAMSTSDMYDANMRGKGIQIIHILQDFLWSHGDKGEPPLIEDPEMMAVASGTEEEEDETEEIIDAVESVQLENTESKTPNSAERGENRELEGQCNAAAAAGDTEEKAPEEEEVGNDVGDTEENDDDDVDTEKSMTPVEMDDLLTQCFLCALKIKVKKSDLPLLTSAFYSRHMLPCRPKGTRLDIKKSTHKKLTKFLQGKKKKVPTATLR